MHTEVLNVIQVVFRAWGYTVPLLTHVYRIYWLRTEISNSEVLRRATPVSTFRLLYLQPCLRNSSGAGCRFGLMHLLTAWRLIEFITWCLN